MVYTLKASTPQFKNSLDKELQVSFLQKASKIKIKKKKIRNSQNPPPKPNTKTPIPQQNKKNLSNKKLTNPQEPLTWVQPSWSFNPCSKIMHQEETLTTLKATLYIHWGVQMIKTLYRSLISFHPCNQFMDKESATAILRPQVHIHGKFSGFFTTVFNRALSRSKEICQDSVHGSQINSLRISSKPRVDWDADPEIYIS